MADEEKNTEEIEKGFGTGLRAQLERRLEALEQIEVPATPLAPAGPILTGQNGEAAEAELRKLTSELEAALAREQDLRNELLDRTDQRQRDTDLEHELGDRAAELDLLAARVATAEAELEERERRVTEQLQMIKAEKERLSEIENRVVSDEAITSERSSQIESKLRELKEWERERDKTAAQLSKQAAAVEAQEAKLARREA
jgi:chromosome segregation ATPase